MKEVSLGRTGPVKARALFGLHAEIKLVWCSFDLDVLGGDVTMLPGLEAWLNSFIASTVLRCATLACSQTTP